MSDKSAKRPDLVQMSVVKSDVAEKNKKENKPKKTNRKKKLNVLLRRPRLGPGAKSFTSPPAIHHRDANKTLVFTAGGANSVTDGETSAHRGVRSYLGL